MIRRPVLFLFVLLGLLAAPATAMADMTVTWVDPVNPADAIVTLTGTAAAESVDITSGGTNSVVFDADGIDVVLGQGAGSCLAANLNGADAQSEVECSGVPDDWEGIVVNLAGGDDRMYASGVPNIPITATGGTGEDYLQGGDAVDVLDGGADADSVRGEGGADQITVGGSSSSNDDFGYGDEGNDTITAASSTAGTTVRIYGGQDDDTLTGGAGTGSLSGSSGNDTITSGTGYIGLSGEEGNDILDARAMVTSGYSGPYGGAGNDTIYGGAVDLTLGGGPGDDTIVGGAGSEQLSGDEGIDSLSGGAGDDVLSPGSADVDAGLETVYGSDGADTVSGGEGSDTVDYSNRNLPIVVDLSVAGGDGQAGESDQIALDVEGINGGNAADTLTGSEASNEIHGGNGGDIIDGRGGFDVLIGDRDADRIEAQGDGTPDSIDCGSQASVGQLDADVAVLDFSDLLTPASDCETVERSAKPPSTGDPAGATAGNDVLLGAGTADVIFGLAGNDTIRGNAGNDELYGNAGNDAMRGGAGNDELHGGPGVDSLLGEAGNDILIGGAGKDKLDGGAGKDFLVGRDGAKGDTITCTKLNVRIKKLRAQRDVVVADVGDVIKNRVYCARIVLV